MLRILAFGLAFAATGASAGAVSAATKVAHRDIAPVRATENTQPCRLTGTQALSVGLSSGLRATPTYACAYDENAARQRIAMFFDTSRDLGMESVAAVLGLPELTSNYDDPREASYYAIVTGAGGWQYTVWVRESFYPLNKGPAAFVPGLHPKRLRRLADSSRRLDINFTISPVAGRSEQDCEALYSYTKTARSAGWKVQIPDAIPTDGGRAAPIVSHSVV